MRVTILGTGYVGLVTGAGLASVGHHVTCLDRDEEKIDRLRAGTLPFYEPDLETLLHAAGSRLTFAPSVLPIRSRLLSTLEAREALAHAEVIFLCVGTPSDMDGRADVRAIEGAVGTIRESFRKGTALVVTKSTVPVGTGEWIESLLSGSGATFEVVSNPEFLREGTAVQDTLNPDRILIGSETPHAVETMRALYQPLIGSRMIPFVVTDRLSAEMVKYAANAFLATKISFINEIANVCEHVGADVKEVARGIGLDPRIGPAFLNAGVGWGGSCFPKDLSELIGMAREYGTTPHLLEAVRDVNTAQRQRVVETLHARLGRLRGKTIALLGLAFKPGTDDLRDTPALPIAKGLLARGACVRSYDPQALTNARLSLFPGQLFPDAYAAVTGADAVVLLTEWPEFLGLDWERVRLAMRTPLIVDGRNALDRTVLLKLGFRYLGIGR